MAATYDDSMPTTRDKVRRYIGDVNVSAAFFSDDEIDAFLSDANDDVFLATMLALLAWSADAALIQKAIDLGTWKGTRDDVAEQLRKTAAEFGEMADEQLGTVEPIAKFARIGWTPQTDAQRTIAESLEES